MRQIIINQINSYKNHDKPLTNLKVVVDAGNGSGGFITKEILEPLGAVTQGSINLEPDGNFPDHEPNTESISAIKSLQKQVIETDADLGIIFDSDADRCAFVNNEGKPILHDNFVALLTTIVAEENTKPTIVTDSITSDDLSNFIQKELGGIHHRFKRGYRKVINEAIRLNNDGINCPLAIETSGHAAFKDNNFMDDGVLLAAKVIIKLANIKHKGQTTISEFYSRYSTSKVTMQFRLRILSQNIETESNRIIQTFKQFSDTIPGWKVVINNFDGIRISADKFFGDGWLLLRLSLHEPVLVLNIESGSKRGMMMILKRAVKLLSRITSVNISTLNTYIEVNQ
ncbi:phosphomannomutase/phosphoglucomutase [Bacteroidota bacterium]